MASSPEATATFAETSVKIAAAGRRIRRGPYNAFTNTTKTPLNIVAMFNAVNPRRFVEPESYLAPAKIGQADTHPAGAFKRPRAPHLGTRPHPEITDSCAAARRFA